MAVRNSTPRNFKPKGAVLLDVSTRKYPNKHALIDADMAVDLAAISWSINDSGYIRGQVNGKEVKLHRYIVSANDNDICDHINRDILDNRRCNLRKVSALQNSVNRRGLNPEQFKGVYQCRGSDKYEARIRAFGKSQYLGRYSTAEQAARIYDMAAHAAYGEHAFLNFGVVDQSSDQYKIIAATLKGKKRPYVRYQRMLKQHKVKKALTA